MSRPGHDLREAWTPVLLLGLLTIAGLQAVFSLEDEVIVRVENFSDDPEWHGRGNLRVAGCRTVVQDFGFSLTNHAGLEQGEIGGRISRSTTPAYYAHPMGIAGLDDGLAASGSIILIPST